MAGYSSQEFADRWRRLTLAEQMGNIGSEFDRVIAWRKKNKPENAERAFDRTLELLDLTIADPRWMGPKLKELMRVREFVCHAIMGGMSMTSLLISSASISCSLRSLHGR